MSRSIATRSCAGPLPMFSVEDIRQFLYCPRIIYFRYVLRNIPKYTVKMKKGSSKHDQWRKRKLKRGETSDVFYGLFFESKELGLCGLLDAIEFDGKLAIPIELKTGAHKQGEVSDHHRAQVIAQCALLETCLNVQVMKGVVEYTSTRERFVIPFSTQERLWLEKILTKMRNIVIYEEVPAVSEIKAKCVDCEYWRWCFRT